MGLKLPKEFSYDKWVALCGEALKSPDVPTHWRTRAQFQEEWGKGASQTDIRIKKLIKQGLLVRHVSGRGVFFEPVMRKEEE